MGDNTKLPMSNGRSSILSRSFLLPEYIKLLEILLSNVSGNFLPIDEWKTSCLAEVRPLLPIPLL